MDLGLAGRRALVTGGSRGIGFAIARTFLQEGAQVTIVGQDAARLEKSVASLQAETGRRATGQRVDLGERGAAERMLEPHRDIDILVNNAGSIPAGNIFDIDEDRWREAWDAKVFAYIGATRAAMRHMRDHKRGGVILNVIGIGGEAPQWGYAAGSTGNAALIAFSKAMGGHSVDYGIRVNAVNPGPVDTDRLDKIFIDRNVREFGNNDVDWRQRYAHEFPWGRAATSQEIADVVVFLASDRAKYLSGEAVNVDGGVLRRIKFF